MNIYLVVEGPIGEKFVYAHWVPLVNPALAIANNINEVHDNNLLIISGGGYPNYFDVIGDGARDVSESSLFDRLVIAVDSEEMSYEEKCDEIADFMQGLDVNIDYRIIIQHFCLETWALGNQAIFSRQPRNSRLIRYRQVYDVLVNDPARLPGLPSEDLTRSQFAEKYLRSLLNEKFRNLTYTKHNPGALLHDKYFSRVRDRYLKTGHIASFKGFLEAFI